MNILVFTTLYPNTVQIRNGIFVQTRLTHLLASGQVKAKVVAPVPWFPIKWQKFGGYSEFARVPYYEELNGVEVYHPRYVVLPKIGMNFSPLSLYWGAQRTIRKIVREGFDFDLIDAHYFYPDGVAAVKLGEYFRKPVVVTARGTDINLIPNFKGPNRKISQAVNRASGIVTVSQALKNRMVVTFKVNRERINVLRNGVDLDLFKPLNRDQIRLELGLAADDKVLLSVGNLVAAKGHDLVIAALQHLPGYRLFIVGEGAELGRLKRLADSMEVKDRVTFVGNLTQEKLSNYYNLADVLVLASLREGWPNVLLESMACGTPVIASDVGGVSEIIQDDQVGAILKDRAVGSITDAVARIFSSNPDRKLVRNYAEKFSWDPTTNGQLQLFSKLVNEE